MYHTFTKKGLIVLITALRSAGRLMTPVHVISEINEGIHPGHTLPLPSSRPLPQNRSGEYLHTRVANPQNSTGNEPCARLNP